MKKTLKTINEIAKMLKVTPNVIKEMVSEGLFTAVKKGNTLKIAKEDVDEWLAQLNEIEAQSWAMKRTVCRFQDYFTPENIIMEIDADNKYEAIGKMSVYAKELGLVKDQRWLYQVVVAREDLVSTAVGSGVALLHPRHHHPTRIKKPSVLFGKTKTGVEFDAPDEKPVDLLFMLLLHNDKQHLFSLSYISKFIMKPENLEALHKASTPKDIVNLLTLSS